MKMRINRLPCVVMLAVLVVDVCDASSQERFVALSVRDSAQYRFDLERNFFDSDEVAREHEGVVADLDRLQRAAREPLTTAGALLALLRLDDEVMKRTVRYQSY